MPMEHMLKEHFETYDINLDFYLKRLYLITKLQTPQTHDKTHNELYYTFW